MSIRGAVRFLLSNLTKGKGMLKPGDPAPDFEAPVHDGRRVKLSDLRGKKVVLWFYPKADTPG
jgi:peroxiredoxin